MKHLLSILLWLVLAAAGQGALSHSELENLFVHPPASARPWVYWFWLNGNVTSNGITADLEAMQRVGIGGVLIMEVDQGTPRGPAGFGTPPWRELFKHVCAEAQRLGLEVNMNNDAGWCGSGGPWITPDLAMQKVVWSEAYTEGPGHFEATLPHPSTGTNYYRDIAVFGFPTPAEKARIEDFEGKAAFVPKRLATRATFPSLPAEQVIARDRIIELTPHLGTNGVLTWEVPPGKWTIVRLGHTPTGADNHPAPEVGRGLESDKLSKAATEAMFNGLMGKLIADSKPLAGRTLVSTHIDSWETGSQNWTPRFREEFQKRCGYDPQLLLPVLTGRVVDSLEVSERFLWDVRQTVSDLLVENYAGQFRRLAHKRGLRLSIEAYDGTPCDDLTYAGQADEPMAEFWSWGANTVYSCTEMSSAAHVYGKRILGAEAFTASNGEKWLHHPASIKALGDWAFCEGINRFVFHRYAMQPWLERAPGMSMGPWGLHYERTQTWWEQSTAWHEYLARCQFLLRRGLFVADVCFLEPEGSPMRFTPTLPGRTGTTPDRPGYNFDGCSAEVVLTRMKVRDGRLVLPDGMSYRLLVLPQVDTMTPALLRKIRQLVRAGATVVGPPPVKSPSLSGYPKCDAEVQRLVRELWPGEPPAKQGERAEGQRSGSVVGARSNGTKSSRLTPHASRTVLWDEAWRTPPGAPPPKSPLAKAKWIWFNEGNPAAAAPVGERYFRRLLTLETQQKIASARMILTADNAFDLWVNGQEAGSGEDFTKSYTIDVARLLGPGTNLIAVTARNGAETPNPAGLIGACLVQFADGSAQEVDTDSQWEAATNAVGNWRTEGTSGEGWSAALELGPLGMQPWGALDKPESSPYAFPDFQAIARLLMERGLPPDFECVAAGESASSNAERATLSLPASTPLRYVHRRDRETDIYFVANSQPGWLGATCAFRVSGKQPEIWDPLNGEIRRQVVYEERAGRTFLPLWLEPAGSRFVICRERAQAKSPHLLDVTRDGQSVWPEPGRAVAEPPSVELMAGRGGEITLRAWQAGRYELKTASGQRCPVEVPSLPRPVDLPGPWEVRFPPKAGAPEQLTFDQLTDWSRHADPGVKYFSGTAAYTKAFTAPPESLEPGQRLYLDLGKVAVIAQVKLNGKELGTLWKAPFRVDITEAVKAGENALEVRVVNLWVNRMIGDEQLPEDSERKPDGTLKQWPQWLQDGQPSPTGRYTFTTWRLWKKDSPLQESGLLGPVRIIAAKEIRVPGL